MSRKQILARVFTESAPWHSIDGWWCNDCGTECGLGESDLCKCCRSNADALTVAGSSGDPS